MFTKADGPTALHPELVRSLSFAKDSVDVFTPDGPEPAIAALASVWNGKKGFVALILRFRSRPRVERYVFSDQITTESAFLEATEEGIEFAESLGFSMDVDDYTALSAEEQVQRLKSWNKLRKVRRRRRAKADTPTSSTAPTPALDEAEERGLPGNNSDASPGKAVLGRISLERRRSGGAWANPTERLLAFF